MDLVGDYRPLKRGMLCLFSLSIEPEGVFIEHFVHFITLCLRHIPVERKF